MRAVAFSDCSWDFQLLHKVIGAVLDYGTNVRSLVPIEMNFDQKIQPPRSERHRVALVRPEVHKDERMLKGACVFSLIVTSAIAFELLLRSFKNKIRYESSELARVSASSLSVGQTAMFERNFELTSLALQFFVYLHVRCECSNLAGM